MNYTQIQIPTKEIFKKMINDEWLTIDAVINNRVKIELILMYQHGIIPLNQPQINFDEFLFEKITIKGQTNAHMKALVNCMDGENFKDCFNESIAVMHQRQLKILKNLKELLITQYN